MKRSLYKTFLLNFFLILAAFSSELKAIGFEDAAFPELVVSGRALAMGNAFISRVDDSSSAFYNPAGFGTVRQSQIHLSNFHIETNRGWLTSTSSGKAFDVPTNFMKGFSLDGQRELLNENRGRIANSRFQLMPNFTTRFFSMGYLYSKTSRATIGLDQNADFEYAQRRDHGPYTSLNVSFMGGIFKLGATAVWLSRKEAIGDAPANQEIELEREDYDKGHGLIVISGAKLTLPVMWLPTLSAKMNNTFDQRFNRHSNYLEAPDPIKQSLDIGLSVTPRLSNMTWIHFEINYKDVTGEYDDISTNRKLALGMEVDVARRVYFRLGYGDGFGSAGLGLRSRKLQFDLTTYAVDTTATEFRGKEDRRFALTVSSGF